MGNERDNEAWAAIMKNGKLIFFPIHGNGLRQQHRFPPLGVDEAGLRRVWHDATFDPNLRASLDRMGLVPWLGVTLRLGEVFDALAAFAQLRGWPECASSPPSSWTASLTPTHQTGWLFELSRPSEGANGQSGGNGLIFSPFVARPAGDGWVHRCGPPLENLDVMLPETQGWIDGLGLESETVMQARKLLLAA